MKGLRNKSPRTLKNYILIITFVFLAILFVYSNIIIAAKKSHENIIKNFREKDFENVMMYYDELYIDAYDNAIDVANHIENDIRQDINLNDLKHDMDKDIIPNELYNILESNSKHINLGNINNTRNGILILNNEKVLVDFNYKRVRNNGSRLNRTFENEKNNNWNKDLYNNAIEKIINRSISGSMIAIETYPSTDENHKMIKNASYKEFEKIYVKEGIDALEQYQFLVPAYITEDGDIFGQKDIDKGISQNNHKFIVIQEFNLIDQIRKYHPEFMYNDDEVAMMSEHQSAVNILYILGILLMITWLIIVLIFINEYNCSVRNQDQEQDSDTID